MVERHDSAAPNERAAHRAIDRIARLHRATDALSAAETPDLVASAIIREAVAALDARGGLAVLVDGPLLRPVSAVGVPDAQPFPRDADLPLARSLREERPIYCESREALLAAFPGLAAYDLTLAFEATIVLPLVLKHRAIGAIGLYFASARAFDDEERAFAGLLARHCALALDRVQLATAERRASERNALLARAGEILSSSLDVGKVLEDFAKLTVPRLADWCAIEPTA